MKIFLSVGEPSGDLHGANLIKHLSESQPNCEFVGFGGQRMKTAGCDILFDLTQLAVMFLDGLAQNIKTFLRLRKMAENYFRDNRPDAVVLIDYPGFNWWIARAAKKHGIPVCYYGVPQMWAWAPWRVRKLRRLVDLVLCKLPFEPDWFKSRGVNAHYVGHPYFDELNQRSVDESFARKTFRSNETLVTLLPGSRQKEVERNLGDLLATAERIQQLQPDTRIAVASFNEEQSEYAVQLLKEYDTEATVFHGKTPELIDRADCCIACSGSVSLELLYHTKPSVIVYRVNRLKMFLAKFVLRTKFISLPNLMWTEEIRRNTLKVYDPNEQGAEQVPMPEYLTSRQRSEDVADHVVGWLSSSDLYDEQVAKLSSLKKKYSAAGASQRAAEKILEFLRYASAPNKSDHRRSRTRRATHSKSA